jgi:hypothetical protein
VSITKARNILEKPGCGATVSIVLVLAFAISFYFSNQRGQAPGQDAERPRTPIAQIGEYVVDGSALEEAASKAVDPRAGAIEAANTRAQLLNDEIEKGLNLELAKQKGIRVSDDQLVDFLKQQIEYRVMMDKMMYEQNPAEKGKSYEHQGTDQQNHRSAQSRDFGQRQEEPFRSTGSRQFGSPS